MHRSPSRIALLLASALFAGCGESDHAHGEGGAHTHPDGTTHGGSETSESSDEHGEEEEHEVVPLGSITIGEFEVGLAQGHGAVAAGKESHLTVELPYSDEGATVVRAWIGTEDRTFSRVGLAEYAPSHDDYDVHAVAPDPLPDGAQWWIELTLPDSSRLTGSATPITE